MILNKAKDGSIILMHNGLIDGTLNILPGLLAELHKRGYSFVTVSELLHEKGSEDTTSTPTTRPTDEGERQD